MNSQDPASMPGNTPTSGTTPSSGRDGTRVADAAVVRHAPRFAAFVRTGVLLGAVIGLIGATIVPAQPESPRAAVIALTALGLAVLGAIVGAGLAVLADRRSQRRVDRVGPDGPPA